MRVLIEIPNWLGDSIMASPAIENLAFFFKDLEITLIGSDIAIEVLKFHPKVTDTYSLGKSYLNLYRTSRHLGKFDFFFSFRSSLRSKFLKFCVSANNKYQYDKNKFKNLHQVEKYNQFINESLEINLIPGKLVLHNLSPLKSKSKSKKLLGINPGASYGSSKRWYPKEFAEVSMHLSNRYEIIIFGGPNEINIAADIEKHLVNLGVRNYINLAGKTSIRSLADIIATLDLFITGDSGPMHLASAFQIPSITIFGSTNHNETSQWKNYKSTIVKKNLDCQPCMKRECPLKHNNCMRKIKVSDVIDAFKNLNL
jgi:heptosyltransferase II